VIAIDTNVLVYANREEFPRHRDALRRLTVLAEGPAPWGIPVFCLGEFLRVVTHPRVLDPPSTLEEALAFLAALSGSPSYRCLLPDAAFSNALAAVSREGAATGNLMFDAQTAAVCRVNGATLLTEDRDFSRFGIATERLAAG